MLGLELRQQLSPPVLGMERDLPAEVRGFGGVRGELALELGAQRLLAAGAADEEKLVPVPQLEYAWRVRRQRDERRDDEPFRAADRHANDAAPRRLTQP